MAPAQAAHGNGQSRSSLTEIAFKTQPPLTMSRLSRATR